MAVNLSPPDPSQLYPIAGVRLGVTEAGVRKAGRKDLTLMITHFQRFLSQRRKWASGSAFLRSIEFSVAPQVMLPLEVCVTVEDECGRLQSTSVLLTWAPSRGLVASPSECAAACLKFRAAYSLLRSALAPRLLEVLLEVSRTALNARPSTRPTLQASRAERWYGHQPYVGTFLHAPGDLMETPASAGSARTLGVYFCPAVDTGHVVFDLELGTSCLMCSGARPHSSSTRCANLKSRACSSRLRLPCVGFAGSLVLRAGSATTSASRRLPGWQVGLSQARPAPTRRLSPLLRRCMRRSLRALRRPGSC